MEYLDKEKEKEKEKELLHSARENSVINETHTDILKNIIRDNPKLAKFRNKKNKTTLPGNNEEKEQETEETGLNNSSDKTNEVAKTKEKQPEEQTTEGNNSNTENSEDVKVNSENTETPVAENKTTPANEEKNTDGKSGDKENKTPQDGGVKDGPTAEIKNAVVDTSSSDAYVKSLASNTPSSFLKEMTENSANSLNEARKKEKEDLKDSLPEIEQPTGLQLKGGDTEKKQVETEGKANNLDNAKLNPDKKTTKENTVHIIPNSQVVKIPVPQVKQDDPNAKTKVLNAISNIPTTDTGINTSPGISPKVELTGLADPNQNAEQKNQADKDIAESKLKSEELKNSDHGENNIYPDIEKELLKVNQELSPAEEYSSSSKENVPQVSDEVIKSFDEQSLGLMQEKIQLEVSKSDAKKQEMELQSEQERKKNQDQIEQETLSTEEKQKQEQNKARKEVSQHQESWNAENEKIKEEYNTDASSEQESIQSSIDQETLNANTEAEQKYAEAEKEAQDEKLKTDKEAERKKAEAQNQEPSFWDKLADAVGDFFAKLKEGLNALFTALRNAVKFIIEKAKKAVTWLIDKARNAVIAMIKGFASFLKKLVSIALAKFPALAKKFNDFIDQAVELACDIVNTLAEALKTAVCFLLDALGAALDFVLAAYQAFYNLLLDGLALLTAGLIKIMKGIANLVSAAGQSPGHFFGQVSEELLGQDITKPLPNERPAPEAVKEDETKEAVAEGQLEQEDANVLNKKKYSPDDIKVESVPESLQLPEGIMSQLSMLEDGKELEFGHNDAPENDIEAVKEEAFNGPGNQEPETDNETVQLDAPKAETEAKEGEAETAGSKTDDGLVGPFSSPMERGMHVAGVMLDGIKKFWADNKVAILAGITAVIVGVILANILTGGAVMAALPILFEVASVYFAAETMYNVMKYFGSYLGDSWVGQLAQGAVSLARAFAIGAIELVMALLFGGKGFLKAAKGVAKTARKGGVKGLTKMARNAAKKEAKQLLRNGKKLGVIGRRGARNTVKNGKMMYGGIKNGFAKGSKHLDDLGKNLGKKFRFRKFKFQVQKRRFKLLGEINPWVLLASGQLKEIDQDELKRLTKQNKTFRVGDELTIKGQKGFVIGSHTPASGYVDELLDATKYNKKGRQAVFKELEEAGDKDAIKAILYNAESTAELRKGIKSLGGLQPKNFQAHHVIPRELKGEFDALFKKIGFNIEDGAKNGIMVPPNKEVLADALKTPGTSHFSNYAHHQGSHPQYTLQVKNKLKEIQDLVKQGMSPSEALEEVNSLISKCKNAIENGGGIPLNEITI